MAGDWIKMRNDLADDPAVIAIAAKVGLDEFAVVGRLHALWSWADEQSRDGHATGVTSTWVDRKVQCPGFADAAVAVRWLEVTPTGLAIPNFDVHNGEPAKVRALGTRRKQRQRASEPPAVVTPNVTEVSREVSRNERDKNATREEKRREEDKDIPAPAVAAPPRQPKEPKPKPGPLPPGFCVSERVAEWARDKGHTRLPEHLEHFIGTAKAKGYKYVDWDEAFMNAIRSNWAKLETAPRAGGPAALRRVSL